MHVELTNKDIFVIQYNSICLNNWTFWESLGNFNSIDLAFEGLTKQTKDLIFKNGLYEGYYFIDNDHLYSFRPFNIKTRLPLKFTSPWAIGLKNV